MIYQKLFQDALDYVSTENEFRWTIICEPHDVRPAQGEAVDGVSITYRREIGLREATENAIQQAFRVYFNEMHRAITGNQIGGDFNFHKRIEGKSWAESFEKAPPLCKRVVSCLTPKDIWTEDTTHLFSLRDAKSQMGFDVFKHEGEGIPPYRITAAWGVEA